MKTQTSFVLVVLALVLSLSACAQIGSGIAPSNTPLAPGGYETLGPVCGESCITYFVGIIPLGDFNTTQAAVKDALSKSPGATALVKVTVDTRRMWFVIFTQDCTMVQGTAVKGA